MLKKLFLVFCLLPLLVFAGLPLPEFKGLIVQYSKPQNIALLQEQTSGKFSSVEFLNPGGTLLRFRYNPVLLEDFKAIDLVRHTESYMLHQTDAEIKPRATEPNDTLFYRQWHLPVIRATEAWDINRRGVNLSGDTIVIAVIDDGVHINHPDFGGNLWINYADSLSNGIDDDSNGFVDDTYGWNFMGANNDISDSLYYAAVHGTPVAGIIGARGNNITGVAGIMWQVKLMIVNVADSGWFNIRTFESDAIRAYSYVLHQRKLYNSSGGKKGAFVVASNSSWGVDGRKAHEAPLWCAMYDSLGRYGILNVASVSNITDQDPLEVKGDLPTLCTSNHLLAVSSTTASDQLFSSGYSTVHVDLSAPGANIFSTAAYTKLNRDRNLIFKGNNNGTSFAAPMVTAAIGILHANACERILDSIKANPAKGSLMMRKFILDGVDKTDGLIGKSVSQGRLNIKRSLEAMEQYCLGYTRVSEIEKNRVYLFPNPGNGHIELLSEHTPESVLCFDATGRHIDCVFADGIIQFPESSAPGVYFLQVQISDSTYRVKYLKDR